MGRTAKADIEVKEGQDPDESRRAKTFARLRNVLEILAKGNPSEELLDLLDGFLDEFTATYDKVRMSSAERSWDLFHLQQPRYLRKTVHELGLSKRFLDGVVHREFQQCHFDCKLNSNIANDWRRHVLAGDLMVLNPGKILRLNSSMRSTLRDTERVLSEHGIFLAGTYPEGWIPIQERLKF